MKQVAVCVKYHIRAGRSATSIVASDSSFLFRDSLKTAVLFHFKERSFSESMKKIKSYTGIWNVEKVLYAINDFNLPFPVTFTQITWFVITEFIGS